MGELLLWGRTSSSTFRLGRSRGGQGATRPVPSPRTRSLVRLFRRSRLPPRPLSFTRLCPALVVVSRNGPEFCRQFPRTPTRCSVAGRCRFIVGTRLGGKRRDPSQGSHVGDGRAPKRPRSRQPKEMSCDQQLTPHPRQSRRRDGGTTASLPHRMCRSVLGNLDASRSKGRRHSPRPASKPGHQERCKGARNRASYPLFAIWLLFPGLLLQALSLDGLACSNQSGERG